MRLASCAFKLTCFFRSLFSKCDQKFSPLCWTDTKSNKEQWWQTWPVSDAHKACDWNVQLSLPSSENIRNNDRLKHQISVERPGGRLRQKGNQNHRILIQWIYPLKLTNNSWPEYNGMNSDQVQMMTKHRGRSRWDYNSAKRLLRLLTLQFCSYHVTLDFSSVAPFDSDT